MMNVILISVRIATTVPPIDAVQLSDGRHGATVRSLCQILDIAPNMQIVRIRRNLKLAQALVTMQANTPGGPQQVDVLLNWAIPIWAAGLNVSRLPEAKRPVASILQQEAFAAIERAFIQPENNTSVPPPPSPSPAPQSVWDEGHAFIDHLKAEYEGLGREVHEEQQETRDQLTVMKYDQQSLMLRVAALEARDASTTGRLSAQRLEYIYQRAEQASQRHGYTIAFLLSGLTDHFRVKDIYYLPEKDWPAVLQWFESLLE